jgi:hypothetical protein
MWKLKLKHRQLLSAVLDILDVSNFLVRIVSWSRLVRQVSDLPEFARQSLMEPASQSPLQSVHIYLKSSGKAWWFARPTLCFEGLDVLSHARSHHV